MRAVPRTILVCEAQVPFVRGGAEFHVRELVRQLRERGHDAELVSIPFKWYPKAEILPHAAAWRLLDLSESNGRADRSRDRDEVPDLLRAASEQGRVAHSSVPRRLRARRHAVQRLRAHAQTTSRCASRSSGSTRRCSASASACSPTPATPRRALARYNGLTATPLYHPPRLAERIRTRPVRRLRPLGRTARERQARRPRDSGAGARAGRPVAGHRRHRHTAERARGAGGLAGRRRPRPVSRRSRATTRSSNSTRARSG